MNYFKRTDHMPKFLYVVVISLIYSCTNDTSIVTNKPTLNDYEIGEKLTWKWQHSVGGEIGAQGEDYKEVVNFKNTLGFYYGNNDTIKIATTLTKEPSKTPRYDWPIKVGKKWKYEVVWENNEGTTGKTSQGAEVVSYDEITVAAGKFMAYKIEYKGRISNSRGFDGGLEDIWWYAPTLKSYIKHTQDDGEGIYTNELIKYSIPSKN